MLWYGKTLPKEAPYGHDPFTKNLESRGYRYHYFPTAQEAAAFIAGQFAGKTIGFGGSMTLQGMGLYEKLAEKKHRLLALEGPRTRDLGPGCPGPGLSHQRQRPGRDRGAGEHRRHRQPGSPPATGAHETVCYLVGVNKVAEDFHQALWRARNVAAPLNARRLQRKTPCALKDLKCYDCKSPERICNGLSVLWRPMGG